MSSIDMKPRFQSVLVANRGEIACRVIKTAKSLAYRTIAVYSSADQGAPHVQMADQAIEIGSAAATDSYLKIEKLLSAAKQCGAEAIHPGYGFLSENSEFSKACNKAGIVFIGPSEQAIDLMGNKAQAKREMIAAGVPCIPGYQDPDQSDEALINAASEIGFPIMVKAAAGGGGKGMRLVNQDSDLANAIDLARSEALNAFGSQELILEKAVIKPRHVEVQVFADNFGHTIHLGERDCSVQRRHQKVIEEAPCPIMTPELRERMGAAAVAAAKSINYTGAGTVEFLLDSNGDFYFLEMNTRLQVEHPVTELVTGLDLVALQLQVAQGLPLGLNQDDVQLKGHAIEVRLYTEDPCNDFLPTPGKVALWEPAVGNGIRVDDGISTGYEVSSFYDPMVAKVIAFGDDREVARRRLLNALQNTWLLGVKHNKYFLLDCLERLGFVEAKASTSFIEEEFDESDLKLQEPNARQCAIAACLAMELQFIRSRAQSLGVPENLKNWTSGGALSSQRRFEFDHQSFDVRIGFVKNGYQVSVSSGDDQSDQSFEVAVLDVNTTNIVVMVDGVKLKLGYIELDNGSLHIAFPNIDAEFKNSIGAPLEADGESLGGLIRAPMHGLVLEVSQQAGAHVRKGDCLLVLEAMKMQHQIQAQNDGHVEVLNVNVGDQVSAGDVLLEIEVKKS